MSCKQNAVVAYNTWNNGWIYNKFTKENLQKEETDINILVHSKHQEQEK